MVLPNRASIKCRWLNLRSFAFLSPSIHHSITINSYPLQLKFLGHFLTMSLARHIDPDAIIDSLRCHPSKAHQHHLHVKNVSSSITPYSSRYASQQEVSKFRIPQEGAPADAVHQMLKDELDLDGKQTSCATVSTTSRRHLLLF